MESLKTFLTEHPAHELGTGMLASIYAELGMRDQAAELFRDILSTYPNNPLARFQLGQLVFDQNDPDGALEIWQALLAAPEDYMGHFYSALALLKLDRVSEACFLMSVTSQRMPKTHALRTHLETLIESFNNE